MRLEAISFVNPASGQVDIVWDAYRSLQRGGSNTYLQWGVLSGGSILAPSIATVLGGETGTNIESGRGIVRQRVTGLTPGATSTWTWAQRRFNAGAAGGSCSTLFGGGNAAVLVVGAATMQIREVEVAA